MGITKMTRQAIFLDRDGVLNHAVIRNGKPYPPRSLEELSIPDDAEASLHRLKIAGFYLIGATNQPDVARGILTRETVQAMNQILIQKLHLDDILVCYHDDSDRCVCRKPLPGLLHEGAKLFNIDLSASIMIGDRWKDIEAGIEAGCRTIWLRANYKEKTPPRSPHFIAKSLTDAVDWILNIKG